MMTVTAATSFLVLLLYSMRAGALFPATGAWDRIIRAGIAGIFVALTTGLAERARVGDPFEWFHALLLTALLVTDVGYVAVLSGQLITLHRLAHRLGRSTCAHPECQHGRGEISGITGISADADTTAPGHR